MIAPSPDIGKETSSWARTAAWRSPRWWSGKHGSRLLHLGGQVDYDTAGITVTLERPDTPRIARALTLLIDERNATPAHIPGDRRPITYQVSPA